MISFGFSHIIPYIGIVIEILHIKIVFCPIHALYVIGVGTLYALMDGLLAHFGKGISYPVLFEWNAITVIIVIGISIANVLFFFLGYVCTTKRKLGKKYEKLGGGNMIDP